MPRAVVLGCSGLILTDEETRFFRDADPLGFILFARNIDTLDQVRRLIAQLRETVRRCDAPVLIDQEGGRVARLKPPHWPAFPEARTFGDLAKLDEAKAIEACRINASLIGYELCQLGIDVNCAPVLDVPVAGTHDAIGGRALAHDPETVARLGRAVCEGLMQAGVMPVLKHMPGHGRATVDSHESLPMVIESRNTLSATDFAPFKVLADMPWGMVAHVVYRAIDPAHCASTSNIIVQDVIRGEIGFRGITIADDIGMQALSGSMRQRAEATLAAGLDLTLHCSGKMEEMTSLVEIVPELSPAVLEKLASARSMLGTMTGYQAEDVRSRFTTLTG